MHGLCRLLAGVPGLRSSALEGWRHRHDRIGGRRPGPSAATGRGGARALRYYERIGLLSVARYAAERRVYDASNDARVVFLNRLWMTGMSISDLQRYVALIAEGDVSVPDRLRLLLAHRDAVRA
jgi:MerR HTH family regulatory protein